MADDTDSDEKPSEDADRDERERDAETPDAEAETAEAETDEASSETTEEESEVAEAETAEAEREESSAAEPAEAETDAETRDDLGEVGGHEMYRETAYDDADDVTEDDETAGGQITGDEEGDHDKWWDVGLVGTLLIGGVLLFLFPEPLTSTVGMVLLAVGVIAWVAGALM